MSKEDRTTYDPIPAPDHRLHQVCSCPGDFLSERPLTPVCVNRTPEPLVRGTAPGAPIPTRTKLTVAICLVVFLTHVMVIITVGRGGQSVDSPARDTHQISKSNMATVSKSRSKRSSDDTVEDRTSRPLSDDELGSGLLDASSQFGNSGKCRTGHVQGLGPFCDPDGCLLKAQEDGPGPMDRTQGPTTPNTSYENLGVYRTSSSHNMFLFVSILSGIQKDFGLRGSVGFFNDKKSMFSDYFASTAARGEHVLKWGPVNGVSNPKSAKQNTHLLVEYQTSDSDGKTTHLQDGPLYFSKKFLVEESIPQFRLISVEDTGDVIQMVSGLESASCLLRDGGMVVVHSDSNVSNGREALLQYFNKHGTSALSPCLKVKNRYVLCTTNWKDRIINAFLNDSRLPRKYMFKKDTGDIFGYRVSFLSLIG